MKKLEAHKNEEHGDTTKERFSTMLEMMIEMALNNPGSLTEQELKYHMITFVATVGIKTRSNINIASSTFILLDTYSFKRNLNFLLPS